MLQEGDSKTVTAATDGVNDDANADADEEDNEPDDERECDADEEVDDAPTVVESRRARASIEGVTTTRGKVARAVADAARLLSTGACSMETCSARDRSASAAEACKPRDPACSWG